MLYLTPIFAMLHLAPALGIYTGTQYLHRHLACYTWYMNYDSGTRYLHWHSVFTPALGIYTDTWHVILDIWFMTPALGIYTGTWYLIPVPRHLIFRHRYSIMSYLAPDPDTLYMTCFHVVQAHWLDIVTLDRKLPPLIPVLYGIFMTITFTGTWHDYYIITRYLVHLNSCTPEPLKKGDSWYYTPGIMLLFP